jgi:hypothetical protein
MNGIGDYQVNLNNGQQVFMDDTNNDGILSIEELEANGINTDEVLSYGLAETQNIGDPVSLSNHSNRDEAIAEMENHGFSFRNEPLNITNYNPERSVTGKNGNMDVYSFPGGDGASVELTNGETLYVDKYDDGTYVIQHGDTALQFDNFDDAMKYLIGLSLMGLLTDELIGDVELSPAGQEFLDSVKEMLGITDEEIGENEGDSNQDVIDATTTAGRLFLNIY